MYEIVAIRAVLSDDGTHPHIELVGYLSPHTPGEPITIPVPRVTSRIAFGEKFFVTADGERAEVSAGKCEVCGHEPHLKTAADSDGRNRLLELPRL